MRPDRPIERTNRLSLTAGGAPRRTLWPPGVNVKMRPGRCFGPEPVEKQRRRDRTRKRAAGDIVQIGDG